MIVTEKNYYNIYAIYKNHIKLYDILELDYHYEEMLKHAHVLRDFYEMNPDYYERIDKNSQFNRYILIGNDSYKGPVKP